MTSLQYLFYIIYFEYRTYFKKFKKKDYTVSCTTNYGGVSQTFYFKQSNVEISVNVNATFTKSTAGINIYYSRNDDENIQNIIRNNWITITCTIRIYITSTKYRSFTDSALLSDTERRITNFVEIGQTDGSILVQDVSASPSSGKYNNINWTVICTGGR